ncbi:unnamed protein product, partial [Lymnaea stagnalis]
VTLRQPGKSERFKYTEDLKLNSSFREKIDYSSLDHFYPETSRAHDEQYLQQGLFSLSGVRPKYSPPKDTMEYAYQDRTVVSQSDRSEFTSGEDYDSRYLGKDSLAFSPSYRRGSPPPTYKDRRDTVGMSRSYTDLGSQDKPTGQRRGLSPLPYSRTRFIENRSPSPIQTLRRITKPKYVSGDGTESLHSTGLLKRGAYPLDHRGNSLPYSSYQMNDSRERNDRTSYSPQPDSRSPRAVKRQRFYTSPVSDIPKGSLSPSGSAAGQYEPEAPPNKQSRYATPPPY